MSRSGNVYVGTGIRRARLKEGQVKQLEMVLSEMERREIMKLLDKVGYFSGPGYKGARAEKEKLVREKAEAYITTPFARRKIIECVEYLVRSNAKKMAKREADSPEFQERVQGEIRRILPEMCFKKVPVQDDSFSAACRRAIDDRIEQWLKSTRGQEAITQLKIKAIEDELTGVSPSQQRNWIGKRLAQIEGVADA